MKKNKLWLSIAFYMLPWLMIYAQEYPAHTIPNDLKTDAVSVVRNYSVTFSQSDMNNAEYKVTKVITILNSQGNKFAHFYGYGDKFHEFKSFSGTIRDAYGKIIKKIKKSDLTNSSLTDDYTLADDSYTLYYEAKSPDYPYTVEYSYQIKYKNGIIGYPPFDPFDNYQQSVEKAHMTLELPPNIDLRYKSNFDCNIKNEKVNNKNIYTVSISNNKAYPYEPLAPHFQEILPLILFVPQDFCYDSYCGSLSDWKSYGIWQANLLKGRDVIPGNLANKLTEITRDAKDDREKVKTIYEFLQNNFRYISIQLGIGGLQPIEASSVAKTNFGDCKGLSNLMKAMLKHVGIQSNYCAIRMGGKKDLYKDFTSVSQMNHVILLVPLKNDSIWLECTSQTIPFGYVHEGIAGHDAVVIDESGNGGKICRLPSYSSKENKSESKVIINLEESGSAKIDISLTEYLFNYDDIISTFNSKDRERHAKYINSSLKLPKVQIGNISTTENKSSIPSCTMTSQLVVGDFANRTGSRLFLPICPLSKSNLNILSSDKRVYDIEIDQGYSENDTITFVIPESYTLETLPKNINISTPYGTFKAEAKQDANQIKYTQNMEIFSGKYNKDKHQEIKGFLSQIAGAVKRKLVLKKL